MASTKEQRLLARIRRRVEEIYPLRDNAVSAEPENGSSRLKLRRRSPVPTKTPSPSIFDSMTNIGKTANKRRRGGKK